MWIKKRKIQELSKDIRSIIDGKSVDLTSNNEGEFSILKNDIHTLANKLTDQAAFLEKEKLQMSNAIADISHQLKTPLTSAMMMSELLEQSPTNKELQANLDNSLKRMEWLIYALLKLARLDSGTIDFKKESIMASELISRAIEPLDISPQIDIADFEIVCDINWTVECLTNIIKNASEHAKEKVFIKTERNNLYKSISVSDDGEGLTKEQIPHIFKRFQTANKKGGFGIGLNMAKTIMQLQDYEVEVELPNIFTLKFYD